MVRFRFYGDGGIKLIGISSRQLFIKHDDDENKY